MHQEETVETPYLKIDQNGMIDIIGDFNPETLADIYFLMRKSDFQERIVTYLSTKFVNKDYSKRFLSRIDEQNQVVQTVEEAFVHPLQSWKGFNEN